MTAFDRSPDRRGQPWEGSQWTPDDSGKALESFPEAGGHHPTNALPEAPV